MRRLYPVSNAFLQAVQENTRRYYWTGRITTKAGVVHEFSEKDIVKGSGYISSQCCGSTEMELGTVYSSEMGITLLSEIDRYTLEDALIELFYHLFVGDGYETVPMGIYEISEANRSIRCLEIKAYDYMLRFEKDFNVTETIGNAYEIVAMCCKACKVELAHTQAEMETMPNGATVLSIYTENDIETYRDVLFYIGQILGGFFCINREGKLELRKYGSEPVMNISNKQRFSSSFSDFITRYTAVSSTNMKTQTAEYYALETDDGLTMNLGVNPFLQFGTDDTRKGLCEQILSDIAAIKYVPFDSDTIGNPALDIGDILRFSGGHADEEQITCITYSQCRIGGKHSLKCVGKNPRLAKAKSKNDKNISGLLNQVDAGKIGIHTFTNASAYTLGDTDTRIISIEFATTEENHAQFFGQVIIEVNAVPEERTVSAKGTINIPIPEVDEETGGTTENTVSVEAELPFSWQEDGKAVCYVTFEMNDTVNTLHCPVETWHSGKHILSLYYPIESIVPNVTNMKNRIINIDHQLQRLNNMEYHIESTKTNAGTRKIPMTEDVYRMFQAILEDRPTDLPEVMVNGYVGFLFRDKNGMPEVALHWEHRFKNAVNRYNSIFKVQMPKITPHICRHTYCSNQAKAGMNPKTLQYLMGHSDIGVTMNTYTHLGLDDAKNEMIRMEELEQARKEVDKAEGKKPMRQNMFKVV